MSFTNEQKNEYLKSGYVVVSGLFGSEAVATLRGACDELVAMAAEFEDDKFIDSAFFKLHRDCNPFDPQADEFEAVKGMLRRVTYPYRVSKTINQFRTHDRLLSCVKSLFGDEVVQLVNQVNFNQPKVGTGWGWHQDYRFRKPGLTDPQRNYVQCLVALDPCNEQTGGLRIVPGSDSLGELKLDVNQADAESKFDPATAVTPELQPGDAVFFNPLMIHGSSANNSEGSRRVFINGYANANGCSYGLPVLSAGKVVNTTDGIMEYEGEQEMIAKAAKY